jgi:hypothetical protein
MAPIMKLPTRQELQALRKGQRKRKLPRIFDGMWCSEPGIGGVKLNAVGSDFSVDWVSFDNGSKSEVKHAVWSSLCSAPDLEMQRLEIGLVISEILQAQGQKVQDSIGHPIDAFNEAKPYRDAAEEWKHWATVKAGHMIGL